MVLVFFLALKSLGLFFFALINKRVKSLVGKGSLGGKNESYTNSHRK